MDKQEKTLAVRQLARNLRQERKFFTDLMKYNYQEYTAGSLCVSYKAYAIAYCLFSQQLSIIDDDSYYALQNWITGWEDELDAYFSQKEKSCNTIQCN